MNSSVSSINTKIVLKNDISDISREHMSVPGAQRFPPRINKTFKCLKRSKWRFRKHRLVYGRKQPFTLQAPFGVPAVVTLQFGVYLLMKRLKALYSQTSPHHTFLSLNKAR